MGLGTPQEVVKTIAQFTVGLENYKCEIPICAATGLPELAHVVNGLEGCSQHDVVFVALRLLKIMMVEMVGHFQLMAMIFIQK